VAAAGALPAVTLVLVLVMTAGSWTKGQRNPPPAWIAEKVARVDRAAAALLGSPPAALSRC
jgi:hypothetical protein